MSSPSFVDQCRPPWVVFPDLDPRELAGYLRHWKASPEWREALEFHFTEDPAFDAAADVRESEEHLARHRQERAARLARKPWWARLFQSGD